MLLKWNTDSSASNALQSTSSLLLYRLQYRAIHILQLITVKTIFFSRQMKVKILIILVYSLYKCCQRLIQL